MVSQTQESPKSRTLDNPDWMDVPELAMRMGIGLTSAYDAAQRDALPVPVVRVGRMYRFSRAAYDALHAKQHDSKEGTP